MAISPEDSVGPRFACVTPQTAGGRGLAAAVQDSHVLLGDGGLLPLMFVRAHGAQVLETSLAVVACGLQYLQPAGTRLRERH